MSLTPRNIEEQKFTVSMRGYDKAEVELFLKRVADEFAHLIEENENLAKELENKRNELERLKKIEKDLQNTLLDAQETKQHLIENAKQKAEEILKLAEDKAKQIIDDAENLAQEQKKSIAELNELKNRLLAELNSIIKTQESFLHKSKIIDLEKSPSTVEEIQPEEEDIPSSNLSESETSNEENATKNE